MEDRPLVAPANSALTKRFYGFDSRLVGAGSSHTKDVKNGSGPCLHGTQDEVGTTKHNWSPSVSI